MSPCAWAIPGSFGAVDCERRRRDLLSAERTRQDLLQKRNDECVQFGGIAHEKKNEGLLRFGVSNLIRFIIRPLNA